MPRRRYTSIPRGSRRFAGGRVAATSCGGLRFCAAHGMEPWPRRRALAGVNRVGDGVILARL
jgi:hypothetical protein